MLDALDLCEWDVVRDVLRHHDYKILICLDPTSKAMDFQHFHKYWLNRNDLWMCLVVIQTWSNLLISVVKLPRVKSGDIERYLQFLGLCFNSWKPNILVKLTWNWNFFKTDVTVTGIPPTRMYLGYVFTGHTTCTNIPMVYSSVEILDDNLHSICFMGRMMCESIPWIYSCVSCDMGKHILGRLSRGANLSRYTGIRFSEICI